MLLTLLNLIQTQKISWLVWAGAGLILVMGISMLVYFFTRLKKGEKEQEEDWNISRSLFVETPPPVPIVAQEPDVPEREVPEREFPEREVPVREAPERESPDREFPPGREAPEREVPEFQHAGMIELPEEMKSPASEEAETPHLKQTLTFSSQAELSAIEQPEAGQPSVYEKQEPFVWRSELPFEEIREEPAPTEPATELLTSPPPHAEGSFEKDEESSFDEIWAEIVEQPAPVEPALEQPAGLHLTPAEEITEPPLSARVEQSPPRERFDPPRIRPLNQREAFDPPRIEPLKPHEQPARPQERNLYQEREPYGEPLPLADTPQPVGFSEVETDAEFDPGAPLMPEEAVPAGPYIAEPVPAAPVASNRIERGRKRKAAGTVLGLPAESSGGPLIFGNHSRGEDEGGIGSLSRYGKDPDKSGGRGGMIVLALVILIIGGGALAYFYIPAFNSRVNAFVARMRGEDQPAIQPVRAQIFPDYKPQTDKTTVKARGQIYNISDEPLEGLSIEVSIETFGGREIETRTIPVNPDRLEKAQQGTYEFDYDGKRFQGYRITRLNSNNGEVKFTTPKQGQ